MKIQGLHLTLIGKHECLLEPALGLDVSKPELVLGDIISSLLHHRALYLFYDLSELGLIDKVYYDWLDYLARGLLTINVRMVAVSMQPTAAYALSVMLQFDPVFETALSIQSWRDRAITYKRKD